jgi:hypothetical protein
MAGQAQPMPVHPTLDVAVMNGLQTRGYLAFVVVRNNLTSHMVGASPNPIELDSIQLQGANVKITLPGAAAAPPNMTLEYFYPAAAGRLDPGQSSPMEVEVVSASLANGLGLKAGGRVALGVEVKPVGLKQNTTIVGGPFDMSVDVCNGCLLSPPGNPPAGCPPAAGALLGGCVPQQDDPISCCSLGGGLFHCGP